jgi:hypothetical protein
VQIYIPWENVYIGYQSSMMSTYSGVQHILYCFACLRVVSCVSNVASFSSCPFLIAPSVFSNVYLTNEKQVVTIEYDITSQRNKQEQNVFNTTND